MLEIILPNKTLKISDMENLKAYSVYASGEGVADRCILIRNQNKVLVARLFEDKDINFYSLKEPTFENGRYKKADDLEKIQYTILTLKKEHERMDFDEYFVDVYLQEYEEYMANLESKNLQVQVIDTFIDILTCSKEDLITLFI